MIAEQKQTLFLGNRWLMLCKPLVFLSIACLGFASGYWTGVSNRLRDETCEMSRLEEFIITADKIGILDHARLQEAICALTEDQGDGIEDCVEISSNAPVPEVAVP